MHSLPGCGSVGTYNLTEVGSARALGRRQAANISSVGADCLGAGNPGCRGRIRAVLAEPADPLPAFPPVELIAGSLSGSAASAFTVPPARRVAAARLP